jgi:hypothetical protein
MLVWMEIYKLLVHRCLNKLNQLGRHCCSHLKVVESVTLALKFKVVVFHARNSDSRLYRCA